MKGMEKDGAQSVLGRVSVKRRSALSLPSTDTEKS